MHLQSKIVFRGWLINLPRLACLCNQSEAAEQWGAVGADAPIKIVLAKKYTFSA